ncbi:MAG: deoxyguanosinetriphosphate triphosphohydrolase [Rhodospirillaceae bacterium]|jgi:dGTPase|nr:deoxyguanosinetriphosphate triphosphohydrolase [Rhodospirillaceae bacterium]MBT4219028.1 deoxyguanosinetriphosphate triphosphohydrolase [Rhodospirillaceae bacterium]MBT4464636.1 deoxyguanosinetriphosphate triphosphohydrolase [Rhodospirillaceae bacterium]MBT5013866.1 deoxyguanosinetriphosphate triphosphohydrolase [Rhodospirillaceae bacterium]MBT5309868.1 deoxyguanosinetriphosphate triphosphohydrolase [Rhodospirillaceae bacterium]
MTTRHSLAIYACHPDDSRGRLFDEPLSATRTCFQRDRDRIIHSAAFRRLEYKTQVFVNHEGDFFRTRLTHSLEVAQITRSVCRSLDLNEDLGEALALAHDLGHPPFGHAGEEALREMMTPYGGFDHNAQSLRVVTLLESRYADFQGLNLSWETLEGVVKHNGPLLNMAKGQDDLPTAVAQYNAAHDLELHTFAGPEAQVAAISDDVAYNNHDIDDGIRAGLFNINDLNDVPLVGPIFFEVKKAYPDLDDSRLVFESVRRMIGAMVEDLLAETGRRLQDLNPKSSEDIRNASHSIAGFSQTMRANDAALRIFLHENMYRHYKLNRMTSKAKRVVTDLFKLLVNEPGCLPMEWQRKIDGKDKETTSRVVADYLADMTDRFALDEYRELFDVQAKNA